jgi:hypothetical protein
MSALDVLTGALPIHTGGRPLAPGADS